MDTVRIQLQFEEDTPHGKFKSALYFTEDEWKKVKPEEIKAKKQKHVDSFIQAVETPYTEPVLTPEQIQGQLDELERQRLELEAQLIE
jgi:hypothetical protein